jgi:hypothetical protein
VDLYSLRELTTLEKLELGRNACVTSLLRLRRINTLMTTTVLLLTHSDVHKVGLFLKGEIIPKLYPNRPTLNY